MIKVIKMKMLMNKVFAVLVLAICSQTVFAKSQMEDVRGAWLGTMNIPEGPSLRIAIASRNTGKKAERFIRAIVSDR